jgi:diguanylate cyclase (GGDEF)-like protein
VDRALGRVGGEPDELVTVSLVRRNAVLGAVVPLLAAVYVVLTWSQPHRPLMLALALSLVVQCGVTYVRAPFHAGSHARLLMDAAVIAAHVGVAAGLGYLDGGVASPLGLLVLMTLPILSITVVPALLIGTTVVALAIYVTVAVVGGPASDGYPVVYALAFLIITAGCAMHSHGLSALRRKLVEVCRIDPLTRCLNRAGFEGRFAQELSRASRDGGTVVLALFDLDGFKEVNDTQGHAAGDDLLAWTATTLHDAVRSHDTVGRVGGDEFAAVLTGLRPEDAATTIHRIQRRLAERSPASVGFAVFPDDGSDGEMLRRLADRRLYEDKARRGRPHVPAPAAAPAVESLPLSRMRTKVTRHERRRRAIDETGRLISGNFAVGMLYLLAFSRSPDRELMLVICLAGVVLGVTLSASSTWLAAARSARGLMTVAALLGVPLVTALVAVDGGVGSPLAVGMLSPLPLVALTTPLRRATVIGVGMLGTYLGVAVVVGGTTAWHVISHLVVFSLIGAACAAQGRVAAMQRQRLFQLSRHDVLTECLNRRGFEEHVASALARAERGGASPSLLLLDLDDFKAVNDSQGHAAGDELLQWVAAVLKGAVRVEDSVARLGGDEYAVLLSGCPTVEAPAVAERLRALLAERISVSIGTATLTEDGQDLEALYWHADALMYAEKARRSSSRRRPRLS